ncbi:Chromo shadow domain containing protein, partial [Euroglyphus maynei]
MNGLPENMDIENLIAMNEMIKRTKGKETTFERIKRLKVTSSNRAFADPQLNNGNTIETLLDKGTHQPERILSVTTLDELHLFICYLVQYTNGQLELVPNKTVHRYCPQL